MNPTLWKNVTKTKIYTDSPLWKKKLTKDRNDLLNDFFSAGYSNEYDKR